MMEMCGSQRNFRVQQTSQLCQILPVTCAVGQKLPGKKILVAVALWAKQGLNQESSLVDSEREMPPENPVGKIPTFSVEKNGMIIKLNGGGFSSVGVF